MSKKAPLYILPHGIEVIGEYAPNAKCPYWRVRIRPHEFFPGVRVVCGGIEVRRNRVILASKLGRPLSKNEHAHHDDEDRENDSEKNLLPLSAADHNAHHKAGSRHSEDSKMSISRGLCRAYAEGRREKPTNNNWSGRSHSESSKRKISESRKIGIENGTIKKSSPPSAKGRIVSAETRKRMSMARAEYWSNKRKERENAG